MAVLAALAHPQTLQNMVVARAEVHSPSLFLGRALARRVLLEQHPGAEEASYPVRDAILRFLVVVHSHGTAGALGNWPAHRVLDLELAMNDRHVGYRIVARHDHAYFRRLDRVLDVLALGLGMTET